jgi:hypothetical protein
VDEDAKRKLRAKRLNEHVKLFVTTVNATGLVIFGASVLQPLVAQSANSTVNWSWVALSVILHVCAQASIRLIQPE